jgi:hypothetical protein
MAVDPWTAVYLPIPDLNQPGVYWWNEKHTLQEAREKARDLQIATEGGPDDLGGWYEKWASGPSVNRADYTQEQNHAAARTRRAELDSRFEVIVARDASPVMDHPVIMPMAEAIKRDPWNAVFLDIPAGASAELLGLILETAQDLRIHAEERAASATSIEDTEYWYELGLKADQRFDNAYVKFYDAPEIVSEGHTVPERMAASTASERATTPTGASGRATESTIKADQGIEKSKRELAEEILSRMGDMHSHYDITPWHDGVAVFRTFEISTAMLSEYGLPTGQQILVQAGSLEELHDVIIDGSALAVVGEWVTDEGMEAGQRPALTAREQTAPAGHAGQRSAVLAGSEEFTRSDIERDPWAAVERAIPAGADDDLLSRARLAAEYCVATAEHDMLGLPGSVFLAEHIEKRFHEAKDRLAELTEFAALPRLVVHFADQSNNETNRSGIDVGEAVDRDEKIYDGYPDLTRDDIEIEPERGRSR